MIADIAGRWSSFSLWVGETTGQPDMVLHMHAGLAILIVARIVTRRSLGSFVPLAWVAAAQGLNEVLDRLAAGLWRPDTLSDTVYTLFWPLVLCLAVRFRPTRGRRR